MRVSALADCEKARAPSLKTHNASRIREGTRYLTVTPGCAGRTGANWCPRPDQEAPRTAPTALLAYERLRRERVAQIQRGARENGRRDDSAYSDLGVRDAQIAAHAAFRKRLYDHDVVPDAEATAAMLT
jgi:hypothetical protein